MSIVKATGKTCWKRSHRAAPQLDWAKVPRLLSANTLACIPARTNIPELFYCFSIRSWTPFSIYCAYKYPLIYFVHLSLFTSETEVSSHSLSHSLTLY